ncbi:MAG: hypothetical protein ABIJ18_01560 [archaeon]
MNNTNKVMASIGTALVPVGTGYGVTLAYCHNHLEHLQTTPVYQALEQTCASVTGFSDLDRLSDLGTLVAGLVLLKVAYEVAIPTVKGVAKLYGARLE